MKKLLVLILALCVIVPEISWAATVYGKNYPLDRYTVANRPRGVTGRMIYITDGNTTSDCETTGGGANKNVCVYNGTAWVVMSGSGSATLSGDAAGNINMGAYQLQFGGVAVSANGISLITAANYAAMKTLLGYPTSGEYQVDIGLTAKSDSTSTTSSTTAASSTAVKAAYDLANGRQPLLTNPIVAGTMGTTGQLCTKNAATNTIDCNTTGGGTDSNAVHVNASAEIYGLTEKTTPIGNDLLIIEDSAASNAKKKLKISNLPSGGSSSSKLTGSGLTVGSVYYMSSSGLALARADVSTTMPAICIADTTTSCTFSGTYQFGASQGWTAGNIIYVSAGTAGSLHNLPPSSIPAPLTAATATLVATETGNIPNGSYTYKTTYVNTNGQTTGNDASNSVTVDSTHKQVDLSAIPTAEAGFGVTARKIYRSVAAVTAPGAATATLVTDGTGLLSNGDYYYKITYINANGETEAGTVSTVVTVDVDHNKINLSAIPVSSSGTVTARKIYRTAAGGSSYLFLATVSDNSTTTYADNIADTSLTTPAPSANSTSGYMLLTTIANNTGTTYTDNSADSSLGAAIPIVNSTLLSGTQLQRVGVATANDTILIMPSLDVGTIQ